MSDSTNQFNTSLVGTFFDSLPGYRLSHTHFRIGSKYHSDTFVHAKGLFQNSFYTSRIGLDLSKRIKDICDSKHKKIVTLVSYERYSELLLGMIRNFLNTMDPKLSVHLCVMADKDGVMCPISYLDNKAKDYIVIVPLISTGSTTERLKKGYCDNILKEHADPLAVFNIFHLCPREHREDVETPLYWIDVSWERPDKCNRCFKDVETFPIKDANELENSEKEIPHPIPVETLPLMEADKSNLNPIAIFGLPKTKTAYHIGDKNRHNSISAGQRKNTSVYGCHFKDADFEGTLDDHYRSFSDDYRSYSHDPEKFIANNEKAIKEWLVSLKNELNIQATDKVIVLSPCHEMTNLAFVNMVNDLLFGSAATMICLEPEKEYPENFKREILHFLDPKTDGNRKLYYVDDDLVSGKSFFSIYDIFRYATDYREEVALSGAILLMNKASASTNIRVARAAGTIQSFVAVNLPPSYDVSEMAPSERLIKHFESMTTRCLYYRSERGFANKVKRMREFDESKSNKEEEKRQLQAFLSSHTLYEVIDKEIVEAELKDYTFDKLLQACKRWNPRIEDRYTLLKVLTKNSFTMYLPLRNKVYEWCADELNDLCKRIVKDDYSMNAEAFDRLLLLIRRSMVIGNYLIITKGFFAFLSSILNRFDDSGHLYSITEKDVFDNEFTKEIEIPDDIIRKLFRFYTELVLNNGACAVKIKQNLQDCTFTKSFAIQFKDALLDETFIVVDDFYKYIRSLDFPWQMAFNKNKLKSRDAYGHDVFKWIKNNSLIDDTRFIIANKVVGIAEETSESAGKISGIEKRFTEYLMIKSLFESDKNHSEQSELEDRTNKILDRIKNLISVDGKVGVFMVIKDILNHYRLVFDSDTQGFEVLFNHFETDSVNDFLNDCYKPLEEDENLILEINRGSGRTSTGMMDILGCENLVVYRIGSVQKGTISGIIGFYQPMPVSSLDATGRGYMLLLRRDFLDFIDRHHNNEEFIKWAIAEDRQRFAHLSGHGQDMMKSLKDQDKPLFASIVVIQQKLQGIFANSFSIENDYRKCLDEVFTLTRINHENIVALQDFIERATQSVYDGKAGDVVEFSESPTYEGVTIVGNGSISFDLGLLKFICLELIINAKKNRYFVSKSEFDASFNNNSFKNTIGAKLSFNSTGLIISVTGTGPKVPERIKESINRSNGTKKGISGLELIIRLIKQYNQSNRLSFEDERDPRLDDAYRNTINVHILKDE